MANYIQLFDKTTNKPENFSIIDKKLCAALNVPCDEKRYYCRWYDTIGYSGCSSIAELVNKVQTEYSYDVKLIATLQWLDQHYTLNSWCSR